MTHQSLVLVVYGLPEAVFVLGLIACLGLLVLRMRRIALATWCAVAPLVVVDLPVKTISGVVDDLLAPMGAPVALGGAVLVYGAFGLLGMVLAVRMRSMPEWTGSIGRFYDRHGLLTSAVISLGLLSACWAAYAVVLAAGGFPT